ncbi:MAG: hypothetical protein QGH20_11565 [Candidatus Latescibacteria bacterium]|jgi:hypothetical protein|nr:hypothetical protein [Candidatus Latescibacterota bacterium]
MRAARDLDLPVQIHTGHMARARNDIARALARHVDSGWLGLDEAKSVAADWLFNNANRFWKLGFEPVEV